MKKIWLLSLLILVTTACGSLITFTPSNYKGSLLPTPIPVPDFTLTGKNGEAVSLSDFQGKVVLLYFGYTFCPDICPTTMVDLAKVQQELDDSGEAVQVVMISVDPVRDTPDHLAEYVEHFHPTFVGLSGAKEAIDEAGLPFGLYYKIHEGTPASGYLVDHTSRVFVIDDNGRYTLSFAYETPWQDMVNDVRIMLTE